MQSTQPETEGTVESTADGAFTAQGPTRVEQADPLDRARFGDKTVQSILQENRELKDHVVHMEEMLTMALAHVEKAWDEGKKAVLQAIKTGNGEMPVNPYSDSDVDTHVE